MQLAVNVVDARLFSWNKFTKTGVAEHSDLHNVRITPLYDDACDVGFAVRNRETGVLTRWTVSHEVYDGTEDNELVATVFSPAPETLRACPALVGYTIHLLND